LQLRLPVWSKLYFRSESLNGRDHMGNLGIDGRIILKLIRKLRLKKWTGFTKLRIDSSVLILRDSIKTRNFLISWATISFSKRTVLHRDIFIFFYASWDLGVDGSIILKLIEPKCFFQVDLRVCFHFPVNQIRMISIYRQHNEPSGSMKSGKILDSLSYYQLLKKGSAP
jgi:hypothetical protein